MSDIETIDLNLRRALQMNTEGRTDHSLDTTLRNVLKRPRVGKIDPHGEPEGVVTRPDQLHSSYHASTVIICKDIAELLVKRFPDWAWAVQPNEFGQIINIFNLHLSTVFGYTIRMKDIMDDPRRREAIRGGHEILRRFNMPDRFKPERVMEMPRDAHGQGIPDISDFEDRKMVREAEIARKLDSGEWQIVEVNGMRYLRTGRQ